MIPSISSEQLRQRASRPPPALGAGMGARETQRVGGMRAPNGPKKMATPPTSERTTAWWSQYSQLLVSEPLDSPLLRQARSGYVVRSHGLVVKQVAARDSSAHALKVQQLPGAATRATTPARPAPSLLAVPSGKMSDIRVQTGPGRRRMIAAHARASQQLPWHHIVNHVPAR